MGIGKATLSVAQGSGGQAGRTSLSHHGISFPVPFSRIPSSPPGSKKERHDETAAPHKDILKKQIKPLARIRCITFRK